MKRSKKLLGMILTDNRIFIGQAELKGKAVHKTHSGIFELPDDYALSDLSLLGQQLAEFLKTNNFKASKAVVAINSKGVMTFNMLSAAMEERSLIAQAVKLEIERKLEFDIRDVCFDFTAIRSDSKLGILAVLTLRKHIEPILGLLKAAKVVCDTVTVLPAFMSIDKQTDIQIISTADNIQAAFYKSGSMILFKHIPWSTTTGGVLSRAIAQMAFSAGKSTEQLNCDVFADPKVFEQISQELAGMNMNVRRIDILPDSSEKIDYECSLAAEIASQAVKGNNAGINFAANRHQRTKRSSLSPMIAKAAAVIVVLLVFAGIILNGWRTDHAKLSRINAEFDSISAKYQQVSKVVDKINLTKKWFAAEPIYLEVISRLTEEFPEEGAIWLTSLAADESMRNVITGNAVEEKAVLDLMDKLKSNPAFLDTRIVYIRKSSQTSSTVSFALNFKYSQEQ